MNTTTTIIATVAIIAAFVFVAVAAASNFAVMKAFAQRNPIPSPNSRNNFCR